MQALSEDAGHSFSIVNMASLASLLQARMSSVWVPTVIRPSDCPSLTGKYIQNKLLEWFSEADQCTIGDESEISKIKILFASTSLVQADWSEPVSSGSRYAFLHLGDSKLSVDSICDAAGRSQASLELLFGKEIGCGIWQAVIRMRMKQARRLLIEGDNTISAIAFAVGMEEKYFSGAFSNYFGYSASDLRRKVE